MDVNLPLPSPNLNASPRGIFCLLCACTLVQNAIVGGANNAIITTIEKGFYMTSTDTGLFQSVYELVSVFVYPLVGYLGDKGRKIRWIASSMSILGIGFLVMSVPHFLELKRGRRIFETRAADHLTLCVVNRTVNVCNVSNNLQFLRHLKYVFYLSNIINACGSAALPTLAVSLVEDLFSSKTAPLAQGAYYAIGGIGIGFGFLATSQFLNVYTNIRKPVWLTPHYADWIGAWWILYMLSSVICFLLSFLLFYSDTGRSRSGSLSTNRVDYSLLPSVIKKNKNQNETLSVPLSINISSATPTTTSSYADISSFQQTRPSTTIFNDNATTEDQDIQIHPQNGEDQDIQIHPQNGIDICRTLILSAVTEEQIHQQKLSPTTDCFYDIYSLIKQLLINLRYMGITLCAVTEALLIKGYLAFLSKHIEYQFRTTSSHSSIYMGVISLFSVVLGTPLGAYMVKRHNFDGRKCAKFCCLVLAMSSVIFLGLLLHCREPVIGTDHVMTIFSSAFSSDESTDSPLLLPEVEETQCKKKCNCDMNIFQPVCDPVNKATYQNPCLLGCRKILKGKYTDCECLPQNGTVMVGRCKERKCTLNLILTLCGAFVVVFMSCCIIVPALKGILHSIEPEHRAFSLGFKSTLTKSLGYLPGTLLFGKVIDHTCITRIKETCGDKYQCKHYNNKRMAISLALLGFGFRSISALCCAISWYAYKKHPDTQSQQQKQNNNLNTIRRASDNLTEENMLTAKS
ncbi:unnamed protein product [Didymodactylos carnosus]|uniref:Solute carrier organic anion transporter family member n=1 Tax=Didymodactylos carnosus TaxID=1234261 RepID=A0A813YH44_9BILA|nr:unnamed protein product [Didymodactylos carnosus]CAF0931312.1 unnamed protein product [Didymodactylos carnosus]CAF3669649.1 unnamed protein product [Didymodactylos carnosus]CAF3707831.1 unnamed protein product [Didymodactylos carnosus]